MRPSAIPGIAPGRTAAMLVAMLILWRIIQVNTVLYDSNGRPRLPSFSATGIAEAPEEHASLVSVVRDNPAQVAALLLLTREFEKESRAGDAARSYEAAYRLAPLDREVLVAASSFFLRQGRLDEALLLLDRLVEHYPETRERAFPVLAESLVSGRQASAWNRIAARDPAWIGAFVVSSCRAGV